MAQTTNNANIELVKYGRQLFARGYIRENRFTPYQGTGNNSIIRLVKDLSADGKQINVPILDILQAQGVGRGTLVGNEEGLDNYGMPMWADWLRHAVDWDKATNKDSAINFKSYAAPELNRWFKKRNKEETVDAFLSIPTASVPTGFRGALGSRINGITWAAANSTQKNGWADANSDRVVYGNAIGNYVAGNISSSLANITTSTGRMTSATVSLAKRTAMNTTSNKITPYTVEENMQEMYVMFVGSRAMRDLKNDTVIQSAMREMIPRSATGFASPLFRAGDVWWDNVLVTEVPEIDERLTLVGVGGSTSNVAPNFLCGASAMALVTAQMPRPTQRAENDYEFLTGVGIEGQYGIGKVAKIPANGTALKDWGMLTLFTSSVADA
ncbi:MAG: DUF4043 family protein [Armatimonadetes bacterium]|nr:DUF4043 family protein [Armatimonadota bacterium]